MSAPVVALAWLIPSSAALNNAARFPQSGALVLGFDEELDVRQFVVGHRLPFVIITALINGQRIAVAVAHTRRQPGYWKDRIE